MKLVAEDSLSAIHGNVELERYMEAPLHCKIENPTVGLKHTLLEKPVQSNTY